MWSLGDFSFSVFHRGKYIRDSIVWRCRRCLGERQFSSRHFFVPLQNLNAISVGFIFFSLFDVHWHQSVRAHSDGVALKYTKTMPFLLVINNNWPMNQHPSALSSNTYTHNTIWRETNRNMGKLRDVKCKTSHVLVNDFLGAIVTTFVSLFARKSLLWTPNKKSNCLPKRIDAPHTLPLCEYRSHCAHDACTATPLCLF